MDCVVEYSLHMLSALTKENQPQRSCWLLSRRNERQGTTVGVITLPQIQAHIIGFFIFWLTNLLSTKSAEPVSSEGCEALESCLLPPCFHTNFWFLCVCMRKNCIYLQIIWKGISNIYSMSSATFLSSITCLLEYCILNILGNTLSWMLSLALHFFKENSANNILHYLKQTNTNNVALLLKRPLNGLQLIVEHQPISLPVTITRSCIYEIVTVSLLQSKNIYCDYSWVYRLKNLCSAPKIYKWPQEK